MILARLVGLIFCFLGAGAAGGFVVAKAGAGCKDSIWCIVPQPSETCIKPVVSARVYELAMVLTAIREKQEPENTQTAECRTIDDVVQRACQAVEGGLAGKDACSSLGPR